MYDTICRLATDWQRSNQSHEQVPPMLIIIFIFVTEFTGATTSWDLTTNRGLSRPSGVCGNLNTTNLVLILSFKENYATLNDDILRWFPGPLGNIKSLRAQMQQLVHSSLPDSARSGFPMIAGYGRSGSEPYQAIISELHPGVPTKHPRSHLRARKAHLVIARNLATTGTKLLPSAI